MAARRKHDWTKIRDEFVQQGTPYPQLALAYRVNHAMVKNRACKDDWAQQRRLYLQRTERARQEKRVETVATEAADFDAQIFRIARAGAAVVQSLLVDVNRQAKASARLIDGITDKLPPEKVIQIQDRARQLRGEATLEVRRLMSSLADCADVGHQALGDAPPSGSGPGEYLRRIMSHAKVRNAMVDADAEIFDGLGQVTEGIAGPTVQAETEVDEE